MTVCRTAVSYTAFAAFAAFAALAPSSSWAAADVPVHVVEASLSVPDGMTPAEALAAVDDLGAIFALYEPVIPRIPGVRLDLEKELLSSEGPIVVQLPVDGAAFGMAIREQARVTATTAPIACAEGPGFSIELSFDDSSWNIERRIDRIEITACPRTGVDGTVVIDATGSLFEGVLPRDPNLNGFNENIGARALQSAFLKQVPAVFEAVENYWTQVDTGLSAG